MIYIFCIIGIVYYIRSMAIAFLYSNKIVKNYNWLPHWIRFIACIFSTCIAPICYVFHDMKCTVKLIKAIFAGVDVDVKVSFPEKKIDFSVLLTKFCNSITNTRKR